MWKSASFGLRIAGTLSLLPFATFTALAFQSASAITTGETPPQVEQTLLQAAKQSPDDFGAQQRLGEFYLHQNRLQQGILYLQKAQQLNPHDYNTGYDLSLAYLNSGDIANASTQLHTMIAQRETAELDDLLASADFISLHTPLTEETHHLVDATRLAKIKRGVRVINCARGGLIDLDALTKEVKRKRLRCALDVTDPVEPLPVGHTLRTLPGAIVTPHMAASHHQVRHDMADVVMDDLESFFKGKGVQNRVTTSMLDRMT